MAVQLLTTLAALLVAIVVGYLLSTKSSSRVIVRDTLAGVVLSTAIMTMFWIQLEAHRLRQLRNDLVEYNVLDKVDEMLAHLSPKDPMGDPLRQRRGSFARDLEVLLNGSINLQDEKEVIDQWIHGVKSSAIAIDATNIVNPSYWKKGSKFSSVQKELQQQALNRGIRIRRIFIYDGSDTHAIEVIRSLGEEQSTIGVSVRYLPIEQAYSTPAALKSLSKLGGTLDVVIFDISRVLLTYTKPRDLLINSGKLTTSRAIVDAAQELYEEFWSIAKVKLY